MDSTPKPAPEQPAPVGRSQATAAMMSSGEVAMPTSAAGAEKSSNVDANVVVTAGASGELEVQRLESVTPTSGQRGVSYLYLLAAFVIVTAGVRMAQEILQLLLLSIFLAVVGVPVYAWLVQKKVASWLSLLIVISGLVMSTLIVFWIVMTSMADFTSRQDHYAEQLRERTRPLQGMLERLIPETPALRRSVLVPESDEEPIGLTPPVQDHPHLGPAADNAEVDPAKDSASDITSPVGSANGSEPAESSDLASSSAEENRLAGSELSGAELPLNPDEPGSSVSTVQASEPKSMFDPQSENAAAWLQPRKVMVPPLSRRGWRELIASQFDPARVISMAASLALSVSQILSNTMLILLTVIFILLEASTFPKKLRMAFGDHRDTQERYRLIVARIRSYLVIKTVMSLLTGILIACWLWLFGVPYAGLWGMLAFLLNYIPNIGSIIAAIPAVMVAWLDLGLLVSVAASIGYIVVNMGVGNILEPRVLGRGMGLSALVVFCSMIFWGWALGPIGMLLSVPLTMTARVAFEGFEDTRWLGTLLGDAE